MHGPSDLNRYPVFRKGRKGGFRGSAELESPVVGSPEDRQWSAVLFQRHQGTLIVFPKHARRHSAGAFSGTRAARNTHRMLVDARCVVISAKLEVSGPERTKASAGAVQLARSSALAASSDVERL